MLSTLKSRIRKRQLSKGITVMKVVDSLGVKVVADRRLKHKAAIIMSKAGNATVAIRSHLLHFVHQQFYEQQMHKHV